MSKFSEKLEKKRKKVEKHDHDNDGLWKRVNLRV
jgi:hypothetical protein